MIDLFWTESRVHGLEQDLRADENTNEDVVWLLGRLSGMSEYSEKATLLTTLDSIGGMQTEIWENGEISKHSRLIGWLQDWRRNHSG